MFGAYPAASMYHHAVLSSQNPTAVLASVECSPDTCPWSFYSVGVTALPAAKNATLVQFRLVRFDGGTSCEIPAVDAVEPGTIWDLPALWVAVKSQTEHPFAPSEEWGTPGETNGYCIVAYLMSGGPVDAHSEQEAFSV